jgi:hypothetical protein
MFNGLTEHHITQTWNPLVHHNKYLKTHTLMFITFLHPLTCCFTFHSFSCRYSFTNIAVVQFVVSFTGVEMQTRPADIVAALLLDSTAAEAVTPLLHAQNIAPVLVPLQAFAAQRIVI